MSALGPSTSSRTNMPGALGVLTEQWPSLARAMSQYEEGTAAHFSALAYDAVNEGMIRLEDRDRLADAARDMGIRPFDAQLLIACAIRKWSLDHRYDPTPTLTAPKLSFEYKSFRKVCLRVAILLSFAAVLDLIVIF